MTKVTRNTTDTNGILILIDGIDFRYDSILMIPSHDFILLHTFCFESAFIIHRSILIIATFLLPMANF